MALSETELKTVGKIQTIYLTNLRIYGDNVKNGLIKTVIKDSRKARDLFNLIDYDFLFDDDQFNKVINKFEDQVIKYADHRVADYEAIMIRIHGNLREIGFDVCIDHNINLHHCEKCHELFNLVEL